jgi:ABC-2 type transport system permease protein
MSQVELSLEGNKLPTSVQQVGIITKYELLNYFRSRRFVTLLIIVLVIGGALTGLVGYYGVAAVSSDPLGLLALWWGFMPTFIVPLIGVFFGGDAISGEFQNKTGYFLVGNPLRRSSIYIGKWIGAFIASLIVFGVYGALATLNSLYYFGASIPYQFGESILFCLVYLVAVLGFTFFFSSFFKSSSMSILVTIILLLFGFMIISSLVTDLVKIEPWFILTYGASIISNVMMSSYPPHTVTQHALGPRSPLVTMYSATILEGIIIMFAYFAVTAILGLILFERKEFT